MLDQDKNEQIRNEYINKRQIKMALATLTTLYQSLILQKSDVNQMKPT